MQIDSRLARRYEGTGLGLTLVERLAKLHGGRVSVASKIGEGSCFSVHLPYYPVSAINPAPKTSPGSETEVNNPSSTEPVLILLVEDNVNNAQTISAYLEHKGYCLMCAGNGQEAIEIINQRKPDVILMDVQMPVMDGLSATQAIREHEKAHHLPATPIVMVTANAMRQHRDQAIEAGANSHLAKPFTPASLMDAIEAALAEADVSNDMDGGTSKAVETNSPTHLSIHLRSPPRQRCTACRKA